MFPARFYYSDQKGLEASENTEYIERLHKCDSIHTVRDRLEGVLFDESGVPLIFKSIGSLERDGLEDELIVAEFASEVTRRRDVDNPFLDADRVAMRPW